MKIEKVICDICKQDVSKECDGKLKLRIPNTIFEKDSFKGYLSYDFNDICMICSKALAVFVRDNLMINVKEL